MKQILKSLANAMAVFMVLPALLAYAIGCGFLGRERAFPGWSQAFSLIPGFLGAFLRRSFYRFVLRRCQEDAWIGFGSILSHPEAEIGRGVYVGAYCCLGAVTLEDDVLLASFVSVTNGTAQHGIDRLDIPIREQPGQWPRVTIGRDSWIGERTVVMANVGKHCVIGAGSIVTQAIPDYAIALGIPARIVKYRAGAPVPVQTSPAASDLK